MDRTTDSAPVVRAIFYDRIGSAAPADQDSAVQWQAARVAGFAERLNLDVVGIYTDLAIARSTPWSVRPVARRLAGELTDVADVVVVQDPQHAIGPHSIRAALAAIPIPLCTLSEDLHPVTADSAINAIAARMAAPPRQARRARR